VGEPSIGGAGRSGGAGPPIIWFMEGCCARPGFPASVRLSRLMSTPYMPAQDEPTLGGC